jgi:predicted nucleotide-binding protein
MPEMIEIQLENHVWEGRSLLKRDNPVAAHRCFDSWDDKVASWLRRRYSGTGLSAEWSSLPGSNLVVGSHRLSEPTDWEVYRASVRKRLEFLGRIARSRPGDQVDRRSTEAPTARPSENVFLVHGHDVAARETVARFLEKLKLKPIILHEQPNKGRTIIEKFVSYADVGFAVVLLTGDDRGGLSAPPQKEYTLRPRQNVILELGFFLGRLGRERVCALYQEGVEIPSDYQGVLYVKFDEEGGWRLRLAREMKDAEVPIDMNDVA